MAFALDASMSPAPNIQPLGNGPNFSYTRALRPEHMAASSSISSWADESADLPPPSPIPDVQIFSPVASKMRRERIVNTASFIVEELSDFDGSDVEGRPDVIRPSAIEYADAEPCRGRTRRKLGGDVEHTIMLDLGNLHCSDGQANDEDAAGGEDEDTDLDEAEYRASLLRRREKQKRRVSVGKRTISESIGSDSDHEDLQAVLSIDEVGSSARRLRRRLSSTNGRRSLLFQDPPLIAKIEELDEPPSSEEYEEILDGEALARELPYYSLPYISMEVDSP